NRSGQPRIAHQSVERRQQQVRLLHPGCGVGSERRRRQSGNLAGPRCGLLGAEGIDGEEEASTVVGIDGGGREAGNRLCVGHVLLTRWSGNSERRSAAPFVTRKAALISMPQPSCQMPGMQWKVMLGCRTVLSPGRKLAVCSPQSGG